jgi:hypothetical protein
MYLRTLNHHPCGCVAIDLDPTTNTVKYQYSTLNPLDQFDRSLAKTIATERLAKKPYTVKSIPQHPSMYEISVAIMQELSVSKTAPKRTVRAAKLWLDRNNW